MAALLTACVEPLTNRPDSPVLGLSIEFPESMVTKATVGGVPATAEENIIHTLSIWVFTNAGHQYVTSKQITPEKEFPPGENVRRYALEVTKAFAEDPLPVDVFVLANAAAINCTLTTGDGTDPTGCSPYSAVYDACFSDGDGPYSGFGIANPTHQPHTDTYTGLPMSGCLLNQTVMGGDPELSVPTVEIQRLVSRLRFVFCKALATPPDPSDPDYDPAVANEIVRDVEITGIMLDGHLIAATEYVFTPSATRFSGYESGTFSVFSPAAGTTGAPIADNSTPERLVYFGSQDPAAYENRIQEAIAANQLTALPSAENQFTYLRESDEPLTGTISYRLKRVVDGQEVWEDKTKTFEMANRGDFARNHTWTVYGYFLHGSNLQLSLNVLPWDQIKWENRARIDYSGGSVVVTRKFNVDRHLYDNEIVEPSQLSGSGFTKDVIVGNRNVVATMVIEAPTNGTLCTYIDGEGYSYFNIVARVGGVVQDSWEQFDIQPGKLIEFIISRIESHDNLAGFYCYFDFEVEVADRPISGSSKEIIDSDDIYRFVLSY